MIVIIVTKMITNISLPALLVPLCIIMHSCSYSCNNHLYN